ncbi:IS3 family transposase [Microscilla marina]|uniref:Putative transposase n=1 Tax=Microscilla marina ATCC 23134 TaxID=313606 RepID=A1ZPS7_MICM2|nr:IS3 family transposase [Microscilla marina]EAY27582.1 putative transposase [Microscilla marina ATCC 23134]
MYINEHRKEFPVEKMCKVFGVSSNAYYNWLIKRKKIHVPYVARLMKEMGLQSKIRKKWVVTTQRAKTHPVADNLLDRQFEVSETGKAWVSDITYIRVGQSWAYLTTIIDLADRAVVGWSVSEDMTTENTIKKTWVAARKKRDIKEGFLLHSDRGVQYTCGQTRGIFDHHQKARQSMSRKGNFWDNAVAESFFKTIKYEELNHHQFQIIA